MKHINEWNQFQPSVDPIFKLGTKVKAKGRNKMEYGLIVKTPSSSLSDFDTIVLWDTSNPDDYEEWVGATFLQEADKDHVFKYIDAEGNPINRVDRQPKRGKNKKK